MLVCLVKNMIFYDKDLIVGKDKEMKSSADASQAEFDS